MTYQPATISDDLSTLPQLPGWVTSSRVETFETVAFRSGAALTVLDQLIGDLRVTAIVDGFFRAEPGAEIDLCFLRDPDAVFDGEGRRVTP